MSDWLEEVKAREAAATPGPWRHNMIFSAVMAKHSSHWICDEPSGDAETIDNDFAFIAHARTDIPRLIAEVERQAAEIARMKAALKFYATDANWWGRPEDAPDGWINIYQDEGQKARAALAPLDGLHD